MSTQTAEITVTRDRGTTTYENDHGAVVADIVKAGPYHVRRYFGPDEFSYIKVGRREEAETIAMRHALRFV